MSDLGIPRSWVLLTECIPENSGVYIVTYVNKKGLHTDAAIYNSDEGRWFWDEDEMKMVPHEIVAWQELPLPYQPEVEREN